MLNKYRIFDHCMTLGSMFTGFAVGNILPVSDPKTDSVAFAVGLLLVSVGVAGVTRQEKGEPTGVELVQTEPRRIPNLNAAPNGFTPLRDLTYESAVKSVKLEKRDPRLQQWAYAVAYNNAKMTQTKWCGGKRLFSKPEYERWIACLLDKEIITFANPKNPAGGYRPNGAKGWQAIKQIADGTLYVPLPSAVLSQEQIRFVSARMRDGLSVGEGS
jgi:hypothetical protein